MNAAGTAYSVTVGGLLIQHPVSLTGWQKELYGPAMDYITWTTGKYFNLIPGMLEKAKELR